MTKKRGLGRGLDALIATAEPEENGGLPLMVDIDQIRANPQQPRREFDEAELTSLAGSIKARGILEPLLVRSLKSGDQDQAGPGYELIAGERRWRSARLAGLSEVPVIFRDDAREDVDLLEMALIENLCREDLNPMDEAASYMRLSKEFGRTQGEIAQLTGKDRSTITNLMRLLNLPEVVQNDVRQGRLSPGQARPLLAIPEEKLLLEARAEVLSRNLTARQTEALVKRLIKPKKSKPSAYDYDQAYFEALEHSFTETLGCRVRIKNSGPERRLEINYRTNEDLERIMKIIGVTAAC